MSKDTTATIQFLDGGKPVIVVVRPVGIQHVISPPFGPDPQWILFGEDAKSGQLRRIPMDRIEWLRNGSSATNPPPTVEANDKAQSDALKHWRKRLKMTNAELAAHISKIRGERVSPDTVVSWMARRGSARARRCPGWVVSELEEYHANKAAKAAKAAKTVSQKT